MKIRLKPVSEQVIVILGASSGIGLATARLAAKRGARLVLAARSERALDQVVDEIAGSSGRAIAVAADVTSEQDVRRVADEAIRVFGGFDTWVNDAAVSAYGACLDVSIADMRRIMDTNFWGMVYGARVACAHLRRHGGALINLGSVVSDRAVPLQGIYCASKHAIKGWTDSLRAELAHDGAPVSVTLVKPGAVGTPYDEHAQNYLEDQPTHVPPVYSPHAAAKAILYAAAHPQRELVVGGAGKVLGLANAFAPRLTDAFMAAFMQPATHSGRPPRGRAILYRPSENVAESGEYPGLVRPSLYTALAIHPRIAAVVGAGAALMFGAFWRSGRNRQISSSAGIGLRKTR